MKLLKIFKNLGIRNFPYSDEAQYTLYINDIQIENIKVHSARSHHDTYQILRELKSPQYEHIFLLRNKKGFNTYNFIQKYDVIVAGRNGVVIDLLSETKTEFASKHYKNGHYIYFAPVGTIKFYDLKIKDIVSIAKDWLK